MNKPDYMTDQQWELHERVLKFLLEECGDLHYYPRLDGGKYKLIIVDDELVLAGDG